MGSAYFVKGDEHEENSPGTLHDDLPSALFDFMERLKRGDDEDITLKFSS